MTAQKSYRGLDCFRILAALLVVAIHTSPLALVSPAADHLLTRVLGRVAVPFFFMVSGFFLFRPGLSGTAQTAALLRFLKKTSLLYLAATLLYLPLAWYTGALREWAFLPRLLQDVAFDGTAYHLWYLPACMLGAVIARLLLRNRRYGRALAVSSLLYAIGLLGDSYYHAAVRIPPLHALLDRLFTVFSYTRNGLFMAPLFFVLGALAAAAPARFSLKTSLAGTAACLACLLAEGLLVRRYALARHDSMYLALPFCLVFLFQSLLYWPGTGRPRLRRVSLLVYLLHPAVIVAVRGAAKAAGAQGVLVDNPLVHFVLVAAGSLAFALLLVWGKDKAARAPQDTPAQTGGERAWAEISLDNLAHNAESMQRLLPENSRIMAVLKADAYGHGALQAADVLSRKGVRHFAVATLEEGMELRKEGVRGEILVLGCTPAARAGLLARHTLSQTVPDAAYARTLDRCGHRIGIHIKVDTGMHRLGLPFDAPGEIAELFSLHSLRVEGIFTHFSACDSLAPEDDAFTQQQARRFAAVLKELERRGLPLPPAHLQSSYGVLNHPGLPCAYARLGLALYGATGGPARLAPELRPVLSLHSRIAHLTPVPRGERIGYGSGCVAQRDTLAAAVPLGYADGLPRSLSYGKGCALLHGRRAPVLGLVCMDQVLLDVTDIPGAKPGDTVTWIGGRQGEQITAQELARMAGTIPNELLSRLGKRLLRVYTP